MDGDGQYLLMREVKKKLKPSEVQPPETKEIDKDAKTSAKSAAEMLGASGFIRLQKGLVNAGTPARAPSGKKDKSLADVQHLLK